MPVNYRMIEESLLMVQQNKAILREALFKTSIEGYSLRDGVHSLRDLRIAAIMDEFSYASFSPECTLLELTPDECIQQIDAFDPDLVLLESAWDGKGGLWTGKIIKPSPELHALALHCHSRRIPIVFWNKEDPVFTRQFMAAAQLSDLVFTTDMGCIPMYRRCLGHQRVYHLHFAAQPRLHNPIETEPRANKICFAGAYYHKYPERNALLWQFVQKAQDLMGVEIFARYLDSTLSRNVFPKEWSPYIVGQLPYGEINRAYKGYIYNFNMNSVTQSKTMFARRVFDLMASNTIVVSNYARGLDNYFGELVICTDDPQVLADRMAKLSVDSLYRKQRLLALRRVLLEHLYEDRLHEIVYRLFGVSMRTPLPKIYVYTSETHCCFERQTYENKELRTFGQPLPQEPDAFVTVFSDDYEYGDDYLLDLTLTTRYCGKDGFVKPREKSQAYQPAGELPLHSGIVRIDHLLRLHCQPEEHTVLQGDYLYIDEFNFNQRCDSVLDYTAFQLPYTGGMPTDPEVSENDEQFIAKADASSLYEQFSKSININVAALLTGGGLMLNALEPSQAYFYVNTALKLRKAMLPASGRFTIRVDAYGAADAMGVLLCFSEGIKGRRTAEYFPLNQTCSICVPDDVDILQLAFRISASSRVWIRGLEVKGDFSDTLPCIAVIIPTYKPNSYFPQAVASVLNQDYPADRIRVIVGVNGSNRAYYEQVKKQYALYWNVIVGYHEYGSLNSGRNLGISLCSQEFFTFLDDDDMLTPGYLRTLAAGVVESVSIVAGRASDMADDGSLLTENTYINRALASVGTGICTDLLKAKSLLCTMWAKLYRTKTFVQQFGIMNEREVHTEDIIFWAHQFSNIRGQLYACDAQGQEAYMRRLTANSMSRPNAEAAFQFYIVDRIAVIERIATLLSDESLSITHKKFILISIKTQTEIMHEFYITLDAETAARAFAVIESANCPFLNKTLFSSTQAIAFCHNFSPSIDASAFVATRRLSEISRLEGGTLRWYVVSKDMRNRRKQDWLFHAFYADFQYASKLTLPGNAAFAEIAQWQFGQSAFEAVKDQQAKVIYSRSLWAGSHVAAWLYKKTYPQTKWYAEFSDPVYRGVDGDLRPVSRQYQGGDAFLNTFWHDIEQMVYQLADVVIFTNENQRDYMLGYNDAPEQNEAIRSKSLVCIHSELPSLYRHVITCPYDLCKEDINIGYFGTFYANRAHADMLNLLANPKVILHLFVPDGDTLKAALSGYGRRIRVNPPVSYLEVLNLGAKMDYLYLNDVDFVGDINPYLPSKYADYRVTGAKIIAKVDQGSVLSKQRYERLIKIAAVNEAFAQTLGKTVET